MAIVIGGKKYNSYEEQILENKENIEKLQMKEVVLEWLDYGSTLPNNIVSKRGMYNFELIIYPIIHDDEIGYHTEATILQGKIWIETGITNDDILLGVGFLNNNHGYKEPCYVYLRKRGTAYTIDIARVDNWNTNENIVGTIHFKLYK